MNSVAICNYTRFFSLLFILVATDLQLQPAGVLSHSHPTNPYMYYNISQKPGPVVSNV